MILSVLGTACVVTSFVGSVMNTSNSHLKRVVRRYLFSAKLEGVRLAGVSRQGDVWRAELTLPLGMTAEKFETHVAGLEQATASTIKFRHVFGSTVELLFGYSHFKPGMNYHDGLPKQGISVPLYTPFGLKMLDFGDETNCHLLVGGATRMGKSAFLRMLITHIISVSDGRTNMLLIDHKITDLYPFKNIPNVVIAETSGEARAFLRDVQNEVARRKQILKEFGDIVDVKQLRQRHPEKAVDPVFVIVDEYGRFADDDTIQEIVIELAETAGYVDVHLIISSQRPDAKDVLKPRIKANIVTRMAFATSDETNSKIILDLPDAAHIGKVQGRAILLDGFPELIQVPYMSAEQACAILNPYRRMKDDTEGSTDSEIAEALPRFVSGSTGFADLS